MRRSKYLHTQGLQISATAPHPNAARLFANWMTGEDGARAIMSTGGLPTLQGIKDDRLVTKEPWYDPIKQVYTSACTNKRGKTGKKPITEDCAYRVLADGAQAAGLSLGHYWFNG